MQGSYGGYIQCTVHVCCIACLWTLDVQLKRGPCRGVDIQSLLRASQECETRWTCRGTVCLQYSFSREAQFGERRWWRWEYFVSTERGWLWWGATPGYFCRKFGSILLAVRSSDFRSGLCCATKSKGMDFPPLAACLLGCALACWLVPTKPSEDEGVLGLQTGEKLHWIELGLSACKVVSYLRVTWAALKGACMLWIVFYKLKRCSLIFV